MANAAFDVSSYRRMTIKEDAARTGGQEQEDDIEGKRNCRSRRKSVKEEGMKKKFPRRNPIGPFPMKKRRGA